MKGLLISIVIDFSPMADPSFEIGRPGEYAVELGCIVDRGLRESRAVDTESLCVLAGRLIWAIRVDLHILDNGGFTLTIWASKRRRTRCREEKATEHRAL